MPKQKINFIDPETGNNRIGCLDHDLDQNSLNIHTSDGRKFKEKDLVKNKIQYHETRKKGKIVQMIGRFLGAQ